MNDKRNHLIFGYGLAVASTVLATWLHLLAQPYLGENVPYIMLFPAVFVTAIFARFGPTLLAVVLSDLAAAQWFIAPADSLLPENGTAWVGMILFSIFGVGVALLAERLHRKSGQLEQEHERFSVTLSSIGDGVIVVDGLARVTFLNAVAEQLTGWSSAEADNKGSAWLLSKLLAKLGDHEVQTANDGPSALVKIREIHPEIVLLDIGLPGMDGYQVGMKVREESQFDDVLLVAVTGYGTEEDRRKSKEAGFDEHLVKPPSVDQMKSILAHPKLMTVDRD